MRAAEKLDVVTDFLLETYALSNHNKAFLLYESVKQLPISFTDFIFVLNKLDQEGYLKIMWHDMLGVNELLDIGKTKRRVGYFALYTPTRKLLDCKPNKSSKSSKLTFDEETGLLRLGKQVIRYRVGSIKYSVLLVCFRNYYRRHVSTTFYDIEEERGTNIKSVRGVKDACIAINREAESKLGIQALLKCSAEKVEIIPRYLL